MAGADARLTADEDEIDTLGGLVFLLAGALLIASVTAFNALSTAVKSGAACPTLISGPPRVTGLPFVRDFVMVAIVVATIRAARASTWYLRQETDG